jgi:FKBP-type peptidyl-prolyl cis-trans isomerase (trigger factor)
MTDVTVTKNDKSEVTLEGEIPFAELLKHRDAILQKLGQNVSIDGFRKGNIPEKVLLKHVGESTVLSEMAEMALQEHYPVIIGKENIDSIGRPQVTITKLAPDNPLGFRITTAVMPSFELPEYKKIAVTSIKENKKELEEPTVEQKELDEVIQNIVKSRAQKNDAGEEVLPELTDEFVKTLGNFDDVADFRKKITESLETDKKIQGREKVRSALLEALVKKTTIELPDILIDAELDKMLARFNNDIERMGTKPADYFKQIGKDEDALRKEWRKDAEKRAVSQLILNKIAEKENIEPDTEKLKKEIDHVLEHHPDADQHNVALYVATLMINEKVLEFLENQE